MIPLVDYEQELDDAARARRARHRRDREADDLRRVGTMIQLPRACLIADKIARHADFFSFGTNDLTQTVLGFSRDDIETTSWLATSSSGSSTAARSRRSTFPVSDR